MLQPLTPPPPPPPTVYQPTWKFFLICCVVMFMYFWQAPMLQKHPVLRWIPWSCANLSTWKYQIRSNTEIPFTYVVITYATFEYNFGVNNKFTKYLKEIFELGWDQHCSLRYSSFIYHKQVNLDMTDHCTTDFCIWRTICLVPVRCISSIRHMYTTDFAYDGSIFLVPLSPSYPSSPVYTCSIEKAFHSDEIFQSKTSFENIWGKISLRT